AVTSSGARAVGDRLRAAGIRHVFGHPGGEVVDLIEGFRQAGLEFVLTKHETAAAFMAEAGAMLTGVPGVCLATLGPGATNLVTGIAHAYLDRAPVLAFTGQLPADRYEIATHQRLDLGELFAPITKWHAKLSPSNAAAVMERALRTAQRARRGPVHIEVASDVPTQPTVDVALPRFVTEPTTAIDEDAVRAALARLRASSEPRPKREREELRAFRDAFVERVRPSARGLTAQQVLAELRGALPRDALLTCDVGYNKAVSAQCWPAYRPRTFFVSNGLSSMGYGLPAALGLKLADPSRSVACVLGDGGFAMSMAERETGVRRGLGVTVVVLADDALSHIKAGQERKGYPVTGTTFGALDYPKLAAAFGIAGIDVTSVEECRAALRSPPSDRPRLVAAHVDPSAYR